jgi:hypothetical protein
LPAAVGTGASGAATVWSSAFTRPGAEGGLDRGFESKTRKTVRKAPIGNCDLKFQTEKQNPNRELRISSLFLKRWETKKRDEREALSWRRGWGEGGSFNTSSPHF